MAATESTVEIYKVHLEAFLKVATAATVGTGTTSYGSSASSTAPKSKSWTSFTAKELTVSPIYVFLNLPMCRSATLDFFAAMTREHSMLYISQLEAPGSGVDFGNLDEALNEIDVAMQQDLRERGGQWCQQIFEWSLDTLAEISKKNANCRALAAGSGHIALSDILQVYTTCRSTRLLLDVLNECVGRLLETSPERCIAGLLDTTARFGSHCDWILTFIGTKYPKTIIDQLLTIGASDFCSFITETTAKQSSLNAKQIVAKQDQYHREKLASLSSIIGHLAHQQGGELRRQMATIIQDGLLENATQRQQYALIFVIKAASLSKDVADLLLQDLHHLVTADNIGIIGRIFGQIPQMIIFGDQNPAHVLMNVIMALREATVSLLYDKMLHLAFNEVNLGERRDSKTNVFVIQNYAVSVLDVLMTNMERQVHSSVSFEPESAPLLNDVDNNLHQAFERLFSTNELQRKYYFKCLALLCFVRGEKKTIEVLASILFHAANDQQLSLFVCFCRILHPVHAQSVERLFVKLPEYYEALKKAAGPKSMEGKDEWLWLDNFCTLVQWDQATVTNKEVNIVNLTEILLNNYVEIAEYLLPLITLPSRGRTALEILMKIGHPVHLSPRSVVRLVTLCGSLAFDIFSELDPGDGLELCKAFTEYFVVFVHSQMPYALEMALRVLLAKLLRQSNDDNGKRLLQEMFSLIALSPLLESNVTANNDSGDNEDEEQKNGDIGESAHATTTVDAVAGSTSPTFTFESTPLLFGNKGVTSKRGSTKDGGILTPLELVHSGIIRRKFAQQSLSTIGNKSRALHKGILYKLVYVRLIDRLCCSTRGQAGAASTSNSFAAIAVSNYSLDACRTLALLINESFCIDAIAADFAWDDWEGSKCLMERFLATSKRVDETPFFWDLLTIIAEAYPCLWFCSPIIKAILGSAIAQCENAIDKMEKISPKLLRTLEKLFFVLFKGRVLPEPLAFAIDLLKHVKQYEGACVLGEIWRYMQAVSPDASTLQHHFEYVQCNFGSSLEIIKGDHQRHLETLLLVVQANIADAGYLLEKFIDLNDSEPMEIVE